MDNGILLALWGGMYIVCFVLGFVSPADSFSRAFLTVLSVLFFLPPALLTWQAGKKDDRKTLRLVRRISLLSLGLTTVTLVANFLSVLASTEVVGQVLHYVLALVSVPMLCSDLWLLSLFCWACLLFAGGQKKKK